MRTQASLILAVTALLIPPLPAASETDRFVVIANGAAGTVDASTLRDLYLKRRSEWPSGIEARPIRTGAGTRGQEAFRTQVLDMTEAELSRHWISIKQRTGQVPPTEARSTRAVLLLVRRLPGAFGVVNEELIPEDGSALVVLSLTP